MFLLSKVTFTAFSSLSASDSHVDPVTHTVLYHKLMQACKWLNLDIISSSSLTVALISFDVTHNHLVRAPAATAPPPRMLRCKSSEMFWGRLAHNLNYKETLIYLFYCSFFCCFFGKGCWDESELEKRHTITKQTKSTGSETTKQALYIVFEDSPNTLSSQSYTNHQHE